MDGPLWLSERGNMLLSIELIDHLPHLPLCFSCE
jgi:hypothetical protein